MRKQVLKVLRRVMLIGRFGILFSAQTLAQGIRGIVKTSEGEPTLCFGLREKIWEWDPCQLGWNLAVSNEAGSFWFIGSTS